MLNGPELKETSPTGRLTAVLPMLIYAAFRVAPVSCPDP
jgi:hypothetical protein